MKTRFSTIDISSIIVEIQEKYQGMRVANVYDIDNKTYLIKLQKPDLKAMLLLESGIRIHSTEFVWPKNMLPSGFSMKLRKHLRTRRLESIGQLGMDRILDLQFGSAEAAYHVIIELYDRGNMVLTDHEYTILNLLRARTDESQDVRFAVRETYPVDVAREHDGLLPQERLMAILLNAKEGDNLKKILNPHLIYGPALIEHSLLSAGLTANARIGKEFTITEDMAKLMLAMETAESVLQKARVAPSKGYIIQKREKKATVQNTEEGEDPGELLTYQEFHPLLYKQHELAPHIELQTFDKAVDEFFSKIGSQKLDMKALQQEKAALKKLENVKKDHEKRIGALQTEQDVDQIKAQLIETNLTLVDRAIMVVNTALANQLAWPDIEQLVKEAQTQGDVVALSIKGLKLQANHVTMVLRDPYSDGLCEGEAEDYIKPMKIDIDLALSAYANARKYYDAKRTAVKKEHKTVEASGKALKSAERKTRQALKEMQTTASINKARKTYWYEKFLWFLSSENYVVIGGRDQQQNELIVKKYMNQNDLYVHADLHGASSCVIKNPGGEPVPPKTLNEAGTMALCNSAAWDARVVTSAWWVYSNQVSKTAPTGEYLTTGSFMIRGKKNYLPPSYLVYGFGILFKLDETSIFRHKGERRVKTFEDEDSSVTDSVISDTDLSEVTEDNEDGVESADSDTDDDRSTEETAEMAEEKDSCHRDYHGDSKNRVPEEVDTDENEKDDDEDIKNADTVKQEEGGANVKQEAEEDIDTAVNVKQGEGEANVKQEEEEDIEDAASNVKQRKGGAKLKQGTGGGNVKQEKGGANMEQGEGGANVKQTKVEGAGTEDSDSDEGQAMFPDTSLALQHVKGGKGMSDEKDASSDRFTLRSGERSVSQSSQHSHTSQEEEVLHSEVIKKERLSAKQRREMKKQKKQLTKGPEEITVESSKPVMKVETLGPGEQEMLKAEKKQSYEQSLEQPQPKRRQKAKLKKIRTKYADQDDEERELCMELLGSAGTTKEDKKKNKKKNKQKEQQAQQRQQRQEQEAKSGTTGQAGKARRAKLTLEDIKVESPSVETAEGATQDKTNPVISKEVQEDSDEEKEAILEEENIHLLKDADVLDSLTGQPISEDLLLFAIPVCAPYSALVNYKYKVKLTPGNTKRGKACKTAVHMYSQDKQTTQREKELFKSLKDVDLSRNMPGKVKVSAPNLQKSKKSK